MIRRPVRFCSGRLLRLSDCARQLRRTCCGLRRAAMALGSCWRPPESVVKMEGRGVLGACAGCAFLRFIMPSTRLRWVFSISANMGKVLRRLSCSGSAAWMPAMSGAAILSSVSWPRRRRTKLARLSSELVLFLGMKISIPMRSLPGQEINFVRRMGRIIVGAMSIMPSGMGCRWPLLST